MWNEYAREKIEEAERERRPRPRLPIRDTGHVHAVTPRAIARASARAIGRRLRVLGESIERWSGVREETSPG